MHRNAHDSTVIAKKRTNPSINQSINLFAIKAIRPLTHHTNSTNINTKEKKDQSRSYAMIYSRLRLYAAAQSN